MEERKVISLLAPGVDEEEMAKKADLVDGKVPASQLPSYVDDVVEYENVEAFPEAGEQGKIYVALDNGFTYRWSGSEYIQIGGQDLSDYYTKGEADQLLDTKQPVGDYATNTALVEGLATKQPVGDYATNAELAAGLETKQDVLVSGTNIKTINGQSILDEGDLNITGFDGQIELGYRDGRYYFTAASAELINHVFETKTSALFRCVDQAKNSSIMRLINHSPMWSGTWMYIRGTGNTYQSMLVSRYIQDSLPVDSDPWSTYGTECHTLTEYAHNNEYWDITPIQGSNKPVTSNGIYTALAAKQDAGDYATSADLEALEQAVAADMEVVPYQNQTPLTAEQLAKAERGELAILNNNLVHTKFTQDGNVVSFQALEHMAAVGTYTPGYNVRMRRYTITLDRTTRMLNDAAGYQQGVSISDTDANFLASGETPAADGKRVIREMNMPGTLSDAEIEIAWTMPNKGDIISFDAFGDGTQKRFRVLKLNGSVAQVLSMENYQSSRVNTGSGTTATFDNGSVGQKYANSILDDLLTTTYYNGLSSAVKAAIVSEMRIQDLYAIENGQISSADLQIQSITDPWKSYTKIDSLEIGYRNVYALDISDIIDFLGTTIIPPDFINAFFENSSTTNRNIWLSSAFSSNATCICMVYGNVGLVGADQCYMSDEVHPAFQIDLSKIQFTRE